MPSIWKAGILEQWNNGQKRITSVSVSRVLVRLWCIGVNIYDFSKSVLVGSGPDRIQQGAVKTQYSTIPLFQSLDLEAFRPRAQGRGALDRL